jgi:hypothetical protein
MRIAPAVHLSGPERQQLEQWARGRRTPARLGLRAKMVLLAAAGHDNHQIAAAWPRVAKRWGSGGSAS